MALPWSTAWITGASTGIGRELSIQLAAAGVRVAATARDAGKLAELERQAPGVTAFPADVTNPSQMRNAHDRIVEAMGPIDLAILNAGIWEPARASRIDAAQAAQTMAVNHAGILNALEPLVPPMVTRRAGHIAIVSSVAGYRGLPKGAYYGPSKAAAINLAEALQIELPRHGLKVSIINPGFVETPMTSGNTFPMPFIIPVEDAARRIVRGLVKGRFEIAFPWQMVALVKLGRVLPYPLYFWIIRSLTAATVADTDTDKPGA